MKQNLIKLSLIILFQFLITGCKDTHDKIQDFVSSYNQSSQLMSNDILESTKAEALPNNEVRILFISNLVQNTTNKTIYKQMFPPLIANLFKYEKSAAPLINEGVKFEIILLAKDRSELSRTTIDRKKMLELLNDKTNPSVSNASNTDEMSNSSSEPSLKDILVLLNKSLPIVDKKAGTKILKIGVSDKNELVYTVEVEDRLATILKNDIAKNLMRDDILRNPQVKTVLNGIKRYNVTSIKYTYLNSIGKVINEIIVTKEDLNLQ